MSTPAGILWADVRRNADVNVLRNAAEVLQRRASRKTFVLRVMVKVLRNLAGRLEKAP